MKQIVSAFMTLVMLLTGSCGGHTGGAPSGVGGTPPDTSGTPALAARALAQPVYPEFPIYPEEPKDGDWDAYFDGLSHYYEALNAIRGTGIKEADQTALSAFAGKSVPLVLAGHEGENAIYSPLSLWSAMAMLAQCAGGDSRRQVLDAMGADSVDSLQESVSRIWAALYTEDGVSSLTLANSIWLNSGLEGAYARETLDALAQKHFASAYSVPMGTGGADRAITDWVKEQSHGLIGGDDPVVETKAETLALLASSLYYRAGWEDEFAPHLTQEDIFTDAAGKESRVDFMRQTQRASFLLGKGWRAARLGTRLGEMVFVLPDEGVAPESLLQDPGFFDNLDVNGANSHYGEVRWSVPKFDVDSDLDLKDTLKALGVTDLWDVNKADLTALTDLDAYLSEACQLARVKVDEEGVEAAAVTMMMVDAAGAMPDPDPEICVMDLDRPFLFVIRMDDVPLFVGVVNQVQ